MATIKSGAPSTCKTIPDIQSCVRNANGNSFGFSIFLEKLDERREGKGEKGHVMEVTRSCARRTAACLPGQTRINQRSSVGIPLPRLFCLSLKAAPELHIHERPMGDLVWNSNFLATCLVLRRLFLEPSIFFPRSIRFLIRLFLVSGTRSNMFAG